MRNLAKMRLTDIRRLVKEDDEARAELRAAVDDMLAMRSARHRQREFAWAARRFHATSIAGRWTSGTGFRNALEIKVTGMHDGEAITLTVAWVRGDGQVFAWDEQHLLVMPYVPEVIRHKRGYGHARPVDPGQAWLFWRAKDLLDLSWLKLALAFGVHSRTVQNWARTERHIPPDVWPRLLEMLRSQRIKDWREHAEEIEEVVYGKPKPPQPQPPKRWQPPKPPIGPDGKALRFTWAENQMITAYAKKRQMANLRDGQWGENPMPSFVQGQVARQLRELGQDAIVAEFEGREPPRDHPASPVLTAAQIRDRLSR